jgi:hypothetical protein
MKQTTYKEVSQRVRARAQNKTEHTYLLYEFASQAPRCVRTTKVLLTQYLNDPMNGGLKISIQKGRGTVTGTIVENRRRRA